MKTMKEKLKSQKKVDLFSSPEMLERAARSITMGGGPEETFELLKRKKKIVQIGLQCNFCRAKIFSNFRHDFVECLCRDDATRIFRDGGFNYVRGGAGTKSSYIEITRFLTKEILESELNKSRK